jgi:hypothetical protein
MRILISGKDRTSIISTLGTREPIDSEIIRSVRRVVEVPRWKWIRFSHLSGKTGRRGERRTTVSDSNRSRILHQLSVTRMFEVEILARSRMFEREGQRGFPALPGPQQGHRAMIFESSQNFGSEFQSGNHSPLVSLKIESSSLAFLGYSRAVSQVLNRADHRVLFGSPQMRVLGPIPCDLLGG